MADKTSYPARIYSEDLDWLHQLRRKISSERGQDMTTADTVHFLREMHEYAERYLQLLDAYIARGEKLGYADEQERIEYERLTGRTFEEAGQ